MNWGRVKQTQQVVWNLTGEVLQSKTVGVSLPNASRNLD